MQSTLYTAIYTIEMYYRNVQIWDMQCTIHVCHVYYYIQYRDVLKRCTNMGYAMKYTCVSCIWYLSIYMHDTRVSIYLHARYMCAMCMISWPNSFVHSFHTGYTKKETWTSLATAAVLDIVKTHNVATTSVSKETNHVSKETYYLDELGNGRESF